MFKRFTILAVVLFCMNVAAFADQWYVQTSSFRPNPNTGVPYGNSMSIFGDLLVIGTPGTSMTPPDAFVFRRSGDGEWVEEASFNPVSQPLNSPRALSVAAGGDIAVLGLPNYEDKARGAVGGVFIYRHQGDGIWTEETVLLPTDAAPNTSFGSAVALHNNVLAVGACLDDRAGEDAGAVHIYRFAKGTWTLEADIINPHGRKFDEFGAALTFAGDQLCVGVPTTSFQLAEHFGLVDVFSFSKSLWVLKETLSPSDGFFNDGFGTALASDGGRIVIGSPYHDSAALSGGAIYVFTIDESLSWIESAKLVIPNSEPDDRIGISLAINDSLILIGEEYESDVEGLSGSAHLFRQTTDSWEYIQKIWADPIDLFAKFGSAVVISGTELLISAPRAILQFGNFSEVFVFQLDDVELVDCNANGIPDELEPPNDCNENGIADICDIANGAGDCDGDLVLDECELTQPFTTDCNENGIPDQCEITSGTATDCDGNFRLDECDIAENTLDDCNNNSVADICEASDYALDNGTLKNGWFTTIDSETLWMNRFVVQAGRETINSISFAVLIQSEELAAITLLVYLDSNNDGDPSDVQLIYEIEVGPYQQNWNRVPIEPLYVGEVGQSFFIAARIVKTQGERIARYIDAPQADESEAWYGTGTVGNVDYESLTGFDIVELQKNNKQQIHSIHVGSWLLRVDATHFQGVPEECMCPEDFASADGGGSDNDINIFDLLALLAAWGVCNEPCAPFCDGDISGSNGLPDCIVDAVDLMALLDQWGLCQ